MFVVFAEFAKSTISLLLFTTLGVFGAIDGVGVSEYGLSAQRSSGPSFAFGDIAYHNGLEYDRLHELGHLRHEDDISIAYIPIAGITSALGLLFCETKEQYHELWTERTAEQYAKEIR